MVRRINESIDIELDGYEQVHSPNPKYNVYKKTIRNKSKKLVKDVWAAQEIDRKTFKPVGEPFEITYDQARGFELIDHDIATKPDRKVGKALDIPIRREGKSRKRGSTVPTESVKKKNSKSIKESVSDKLELQEIANAINALNDDRSWVELDASVQKRENQSARFKYVCRVMVTNHSYTNVTDEYRVVQAHRGGFVIHYDNPIGSEWIADAQKVIDYFEEMVTSNIEEDF